MDLKRKTQLRNLLTAYRNDVCNQAEEDAEETYNMGKCEVCDLAMSDGTCMIDAIALKLEKRVVGGLGVDNDKRLAKQLLNEQGFDVDEDRIHIPSKKRRSENAERGKEDKQQAQHSQRTAQFGR